MPRALRCPRHFDLLPGGRQYRAAAAVGRAIGADAEDLSDHGLAPRGFGHLGRSMTLFFALKFLHLIGAAVLLGTGAGIAFFMLLAHRTGEPSLIAGVGRIVVIADFLFTATAVVLQPITCGLIALLVGYFLFVGRLVI